MSIFTGALINNEHTLRDWGAAITNSDVISLPEPNLTVIEVPGRNGRLDLSESLTGDVTYGNREIKLQLASPVTEESWRKKCQHIFNTVHGKSVTVIFDNDPRYFYKGRATITNPERVRNGGSFAVVIDAEPFKYSITPKTANTRAVSQSAIHLLVANSGVKPVCPEITVSHTSSLVIGNITYSLQPGTQIIPSIILNHGTTDIAFSSTEGGTISISFQEGFL